MLDLLVIQPTPFCNIDCSYCYLPARNNSKKISGTTLEILIQRILEEGLVNNHLSIVWHAGEPLAVGVDYFGELIELIHSKVREISVSHSIQTNGTLINQQWCDIIKTYNIRIGISVDGPQELNDLQRVSRSGKSTFDKTMGGVALLRANKIPFHAIAVLTKNSLDYADAIFDFFKNNGFHQLGLNIEEQEGVNQSSSLSDSPTNERIIYFYQRIFERYMDSDRTMSIREFDKSFGALLRDLELTDIRKHKIHSHQTEHFGILSVDYQGNFSTFSPELLGQHHDLYGDFNLGNVHTDTLMSALTTKKFHKIKNDIVKGIKRCKAECEYFHVCGGGAPSNKLYENGTFNSTRTMYCQYTTQVPIDIVLKFLEKEYS